VIRWLTRTLHAGYRPAQWIADYVKFLKILSQTGATALIFLANGRLVPSVPYTVISPFFSLALERFLRAELLHETGRDAGALGWYGSIAERSPFELAYAAPAQLRRAEIFARHGDREAEQAAYDQAATRWANADPELRLAARR
jgi:hypothetical protein